MFTSVPMPDAEMPADPVEDLDRALFTLAREPHEPVRVDRRAEFRLRELRRGDSGDVRLEVPTPRARSLARECRRRR